MKYIETKPNSVLGNYIKCFWYLENDYSSNYLSSEIILPDGCVDFVFQANGNQLSLQAGDKSTQLPESFLVGLQKTPIQLYAKNTSAAYGIRFFAYGAYPFLKMPLNTLYEPNISLDHLFETDLPELIEKLQTLPIHKAFIELERYLISHLLEPKIEITSVEAATQILFRQKGFVDIIKLADTLNLSARNLEKKFDQVVGMSPKSLARVIRFDHIKNELVLQPQTSLTDLAFRFGYFDQAHFIRDFKQFSGKTPSAFRQEVIEKHILFHK